MKNLISEKVNLPDKYTVSEEAVIARNLILSMCQHLDVVDNKTTQEEAAIGGKELQHAIKDVHEARLSLSRPLVEAVDKLIKLERDYCAPLAAEKDRLGRLITAYQQAEKVRVETEMAERKRNIVSLEQAETTAKEWANTTQGMLNIISAELRAHNAMEARQELIRQPLPELAKAKGAIGRKKLCYKVTDLDALYVARPDLCKIRERPSAILASCDPSRPVPGLELWFEDVTIFRT